MLQPKKRIHPPPPKKKAGYDPHTNKKGNKLEDPYDSFYL